MLSTILIDILAVTVVLGVMILVHEMGHFLAAKYFKVRVEVFAFGFGRRLFGFRRGDTDYRVCVLPLGGWVKMAGDNPSEGTSGDPAEFLAKPRWQRFIIAVMGPVANVLLAVVLLTGLYMVRYQKLAYQEQPAEIGWVEEGSPAAQAGLRPGDVVVRLDGIENPNWEAVDLTILANPGGALTVVYRRGSQLLTATLTPSVETPNRVGVAGWAPRIPALVKRVEEGLPAKAAGIEPGDQILSVNGEEIRFRPHLNRLVQRSKGAPLHLTLLRKGQVLEVTVRPEYRELPGAGRMWRIGVEFQEGIITRQLGFPAALRASLETNRKYAVLIFEFIGKIFERKMSPRSLEGPIGISRLAGDAARQGLNEVINLMAAISLNLGIFNLFPIPILDGGVIFLLLIESAMRRDLSLPVKERIVQVGFVFLVLISVFVIYNDIVKLVPARVEKMLP